MNTIVPFSSVSMNSREIAELVESRHDSVKRTIGRLAEQGVISQPPLVDVPFVDESGRNRTSAVYVFDHAHKRDSFIVVAQLSPEFTARLVDRWQELEQQVAQPQQHVQGPLDVKLAIATTAANILRMSETSKLRMLADISISEGVPAGYLPSYTKEGLTRSLTALLKENGSPLSAQAANMVLIEVGILEILQRPSSKGGTKNFKSLTEKGLAYGRNETSPQNARETQPLYYVDKFDELLDMINTHLAND